MKYLYFLIFFFFLPACALCQLSITYKYGSFFTKGFEDEIAEFITTYGDLNYIYQLNGQQIRMALGYSHELELKYGLWGGKLAVSLTPGLNEYALKAPIVFNQSYTPGGIRKNSRGFEVRKKSLSVIAAVQVRLLKTNYASLFFSLGYGYDLFIMGTRIYNTQIGSQSYSYSNGGGFNGHPKVKIKAEYLSGNIRYRLEAAPYACLNISKHVNCVIALKYWYLSSVFDRYPQGIYEINGQAHCFGWQIGLGYVF